MRTQGIEILLEKRGAENHVAKWLAGVEDLGHDHEARAVGSDAPQKT